MRGASIGVALNAYGGRRSWFTRSVRTGMREEGTIRTLKLGVWLCVGSGASALARTDTWRCDH